MGQKDLLLLQLKLDTAFVCENFSQCSTDAFVEDTSPIEVHNYFREGVLLNAAIGSWIVQEIHQRKLMKPKKPTW